MNNIIKKDIDCIKKGNIFSFITNEEKRPYWSRALESYYSNSKSRLQMKRLYKWQCNRMLENDALRDFVEYVSNNNGIKVDLASGPSGYFAPIIERLLPTDIFIVTDACPTVIRAHSNACKKENFFVFDIDLDKGLPFENESIDIFTGNYLNNVQNYRGLISEAFRCLKTGGKLALIEMFFENGSKTYEQLNSQGEIWASFETFKNYAESVGFSFLESKIITSRVGKISQGDLYPLDDNDLSEDKTLYFVKK